MVQHLSPCKLVLRIDNKFSRGSFFVLLPECLHRIEGDHILWEDEPLNELVKM
jgi:hypothetical protein